jgi:adenine-specific DNA-methyltransferase
MDKMTMHTPCGVDKNIEQIARLFPNVLTERLDENGKPERAIDFDILRQELSKNIVEGPEERYQFSWPDKRKALHLANSPIAATLRPCREESLNFDTTENLYIEGDNLDVLKLLQETYLGKIKMIYIDPPYNTGNDFVYEDDFAQNASEFLERDGQYDEQGNRLVQNTDANGRFHTDWLNMMYPRLKLAKDLLTEDGVIFISIDDNEQRNLKYICDEVLGSNNFLAQIVWERAYSPVNLKKHFSTSHDYMVCYAKNIDAAVCFGLKRTDEANDRYSNPDNDPRGAWKSSDLSVGPIIQDKVYEITTPSGRKVYPPSGYCWRLDKKRFAEFVKENRIWFGENGNNVPSIKRFLSEVKQGITPMTIWKHADVGHSQDAAQKLKQLFDGKALFDYPKPVDLIRRCLELFADGNSYILDFFSGSGTTAHAVMQQNAEDGGKRKFIMVQLPELCSEDSEAYKAGYKNICEIGKERIRRAGTKIASEHATTTAGLDIGFRVLKLDSTNMKDVYYSPEQTPQDALLDRASNIKPDRTEEDLLFQVMLELGVPLSSKIDEALIAGKKVFNVADGFLVACFANAISDEVVSAIAQLKPCYAVLRNSSLTSDSVAANFEQIFAALSPDTVRRIL